MHTVFNYTTGKLQATLVKQYLKPDGTAVEVLEGSDGRFYVKKAGTQMVGSYGSKEPALQEAFAAAFLGE